MDCVNHPGVPEVTRCHGCSRPVCADCYIVVGGWARCGACSNDAVRCLERGEFLGLHERVPPPWEQQRSLKSFFQTLKQCLLNPQGFFSRLPREGRGHLLFALLAAWPTTWVGTGAWYLIMALVGAATNPEPESALVFVGMSGFLFLYLPVQILVSIVIGAGIFHFFLWLFGGVNVPFEATLRTFAYVQGANVFAIVPCMGGPVAGMWMLVLQIIGNKEMHETGYGKVVAAVLLPTAVCLGCLVSGALAAVLIPQLVKGS